MSTYVRHTPAGGGGQGGQAWPRLDKQNTAAKWCGGGAWRQAQAQAPTANRQQLAASSAATAPRVPVDPDVRRPAVQADVRELRGGVVLANALQPK